MKKILLFTATVLFIGIQIGTAQLYDATLKQKGTQNEASTIAWLQSENPSPALINMPLKSFDGEFLNVLTLLNNKYGTFSSITNQVINEEIVPKLYTADLDPNKLYRFSWYDSRTGKWGSWVRKAKPGETGLFYPGWEEPILSVYCWNFGYPDDNKVVVPVKPDNKVVYEYNPGTTKIINNGPDSVIIYNSKVLIENNYAKVVRNTQTDEVDMTEERVVKRIPKKIVEDEDVVENKCGCPDDYRKKKVKKPFMQRTGVMIATNVLSFAAGYGTRMFVDNNSHKGVKIPQQTITQGPFTPITTGGGIVYTQGEF